MFGHFHSQPNKIYKIRGGNAATGKENAKIKKYLVMQSPKSQGRLRNLISGTISPAAFSAIGKTLKIRKLR